MDLRIDAKRADAKGTGWEQKKSDLRSKNNLASLFFFSFSLFLGKKKKIKSNHEVALREEEEKGRLLRGLLRGPELSRVPLRDRRARPGNDEGPAAARHRRREAARAPLWRGRAPRQHRLRDQEEELVEPSSPTEEQGGDGERCESLGGERIGELSSIGLVSLCHLFFFAKNRKVGAFFFLLSMLLSSLLHLIVVLLSLSCVDRKL